MTPEPKGPETSARRPRRGRAVAAVVGVLVVLAGVTYVGGYLAAGDTVPRRASVAGVDIGGMEPSGAARMLQQRLDPALAEPVVLRISDEESVELVPAEAGVGIDYARSVERTGTGRSWNPAHIWRVLTGGGETAPVMEVDQPAMDEATSRVAEEAQRDAKNAEVSFTEDHQTSIEEGHTARTVEPAEVQQALLDAVPTEDEVAVPTHESDPDITTAEAEEFVTDFADPAVSAPITLQVEGGKSFEVTEEMVAESMGIEAKEGKLVGALDQKKLARAARTAMKELPGYKASEDATWELSGGKPTIVPSTTGRGVAPEQLLEQVSENLTKEGEERTGTVEIVDVPADFTTEDAEKADVAGVIGEFTTEFPHAEYRNTNLGQVASRINGHVLLPGETFSMNDVVGQRTRENGFAPGWVIQGGREVEEVGGGVSQGATTIFNAAFAAGLEDVEHHPHTLYYDRYPAGREATVYYGSLDLRFKNDTDHAVVIQSSRSSSEPGEKGSLTVRIWGDSPWDEIRTPEPTTSNYTYGTTRVDTSADCTPQAPGQGLTADYYRAFIKDGSEQKRESYTWTYDPRDEIRCG